MAKSLLSVYEDNLFVMPGNITEIYCAIKQLMDDENLRRRYGEAGYRISQHYLPSKIKSELINLYRTLLRY